MSRKIHVIMPMAGEGSRFKKAGIDTPKPLIEFNGVPLFKNAMNTIDGIDVASRTFIVRKEHIENYKIDEKIHEYYPDAIVLAVEKTTRGAADTAFMAIRNLILSNIAVSFDDSVLIMDCDVIVDAKELNDTIRKKCADGVLLSFESTDPRYSYAMTDNGKVTEVAEKNPISSHALTSPYFIRKIEYFVDAFHNAERNYEKHYKEMYISILYNFMISAGKKVILAKADNVTSLGTPEEYKKAKEASI